jgi:hypothetical protein
VAIWMMWRSWLLSAREEDEVMRVFFLIPLCLESEIFKERSNRVERSVARGLGPRVAAGEEMICQVADPWMIGGGQRG